MDWANGKNLIIEFGYNADFSQTNDLTTLNGANSTSAVLRVRNSTNVGITGNVKIIGGDIGLRIWDSDNVNVKGNVIVTGNSNGVEIINLKNSLFTGIVSNNIHGISIGSSTNIYITLEIVDHQYGNGLLMSGCSMIWLENSTMMSNSNDIAIYGGDTINIFTNYVQRIWCKDADVNIRAGIVSVSAYFENCWIGWHDFPEVATLTLVAPVGGSLDTDVFADTLYLINVTNLRITNSWITANAITVSNSVSNQLKINADYVRIEDSEDTEIYGWIMGEGVYILDSTNTTINANEIQYVTNGSFAIEVSGSLNTVINSPVEYNTPFYSVILVDNSKNTYINGSIMYNLCGGYTGLPDGVVHIESSENVYINASIEYNTNQQPEDGIIAVKKSSNVVIGALTNMIYLAFNYAGEFTTYFEDVTNLTVSNVWLGGSYSNTTSPTIVAILGGNGLSFINNLIKGDGTNWSSSLTGIKELNDISGHVLKGNVFYTNTLKYLYSYPVNNNLTNISDVNNPLLTGATSDSTNNTVW